MFERSEKFFKNGLSKRLLFPYDTRLSGKGAGGGALVIPLPH